MSWYKIINSTKAGTSEQENGVLPVSLQVFESRLQVIQQVDLFAALRTVNIHEFLHVLLAHLSRGLAGTVGEGKRLLLRTVVTDLPRQETQNAEPTVGT